jgi:hypothetical protein
LSPEHRGKVLRVRINHSAAGLFAYVVFALNQLHLAAKLGLTPYVFFGELSSGAV